MEKDTINIMFDTNIFLDFTFIYYKEEKRSPLPKHLENLTPLLMAFENNTFNNIMSLWNIFELRDKLMQFKLREAYILAGYSFGEFRDAEDIGIDLNKEDVEGVEIMIKSFLNKSIQKN